MCLCGVGAASHPDDLEKKLTRTQVLEWLAFYEMRPFGQRRVDLNFAAQTYWLVSAQLTEIPDDHVPEKYLLKFNDAPEMTEAERIMQEIREMI